VSVLRTSKSLITLLFYRQVRFSEPYYNQKRFREPNLPVENENLSCFLRFGEPTPLRPKIVPLTNGINHVFQMDKLNIFSLNQQTYIPSARFCELMAEAALVCFDNQNHKEVISIKIEGAIADDLCFQLEKVTERIKDNWRDLEEATEYGATCIAIWIILKFTKYQVVQRSPKKTGFDYWLDFQDSEYPFQNRAKLEISGILKGTKSQLKRRLKEKIKQTKRYETNSLPTYVIVIKFDEPIAKTFYYE